MQCFIYSNTYILLSLSVSACPIIKQTGFDIELHPIDLLAGVVEDIYLHISVELIRLSIIDERAVTACCGAEAVLSTVAVIYVNAIAVFKDGDEETSSFIEIAAIELPCERTFGHAGKRIRTMPPRRSFLNEPLAVMRDPTYVLVVDGAILVFSTVSEGTVDRQFLFLFRKCLVGICGTKFRDTSYGRGYGIRINSLSIVQKSVACDRGA